MPKNPEKSENLSFSLKPNEVSLSFIISFQIDAFVLSTPYHFLETFQYLELSKLHLVMDKGFYSLKNVEELLTVRDRFTLAVPIQVKWVQDAIDKTRDAIHGPDGYRKLDDEILYVHTRLYPWGKDRRRCYLHLYHNAHAAADNFDGFTEELLTYKEELETG